MTERYIRADDVLWRRTSSTIVLLPDGADEVVELVASGKAVWEVLAFPVTLAEVTQALADVYEVAVDEIRAEIETIVAQLTELGAVGVLEDP